MVEEVLEEQVVVVKDMMVLLLQVQQVLGVLVAVGEIYYQVGFLDIHNILKILYLTGILVQVEQVVKEELEELEAIGEKLVKMDILVILEMLELHLVVPYFYK